jgi:trehalose-6-phosphate synthase
MTDLARVLPKSVLVAVDRYRLLHGIRSRAKALERMVQTLIPEHPLEATLRNAPKLPKGSVSPEILKQLKQAESEPRVSLQEAMRQRKLRQNAS